MQEIVPVGDHWAFVVPALLVFSIWSAASSYDYISAKWCNVASARRHGMQHLCLLSFPMVYMVVYISFQAHVNDFKEMSTAIVAVLFAIIDFARTVVGLWQLHVFRHWVVASIRSIESLGYVANTKKEDSDGEVYDGDSSDIEETDAVASDSGDTESMKSNSASGNFESADDARAEGYDGERGESLADNARTEPRNPFNIADQLVVNDLVVDNRLTEGEIECTPRARQSRSKKSLKERFRTLVRWLSCIWYFPRLLVAICRSQEPSFSSPSSAIFLDPYNAEDVYIRWACVLVAQVFPQWLEDMKQSGMSDMSSDDGLSEQLARFRRDILCSAALHTQHRIDTNVSDEQKFSAREPRCFQLDNWRRYPQLCKGVFSLQEFLKEACKTGRGLPFGVLHSKARATGKNSDYSYSKL